MTRPDPDAAVSVPLSERLVETAAPVGRCIGCRHDFRTGRCGGCGAVPSNDERQCDGDDTDDCALCGSGDWALMCDDCRFYAAQDYDGPEIAR